MALSAFADPSRPPAGAGLATTLGRAAPHWRALVARATAELAPLEPVWACTSRSTGWSLRLVRGERVILHLTPRAGHFLVSLALGEKAVQAAKVPAAVLALIAAAPRYAEGRGIRFEVRAASGVRHALALAALKLGS